MYRFLDTCRRQALSNIRNKLEEETALRYEINNPYVERYIDIAVEAIIHEVSNMIAGASDEIFRNIELKFL